MEDGKPYKEAAEIEEETAGQELQAFEDLLVFCRAALACIEEASIVFASCPFVFPPLS